MHRDVAVIVVTYNSAEIVEDLLDTVPDAMGSLSYEVVIVDNGSTDGTLDVLRRRSDVVLVERPNRGYSAGINAGVAAAPGAASYLVLNPDVRLDKGSVAAMWRCLQRTGAGIVAPRLLMDDRTMTLSLRRKPSLLRATGLAFTRRGVFSEHVFEAERYEYPHVADWAVGAVLLVSSACHAGLGGWDESFFLYSEETDFCLRAADHGFLTFFEPEASAVHLGGASGRSERTETMQTVNRVRLYARRHGAGASWLYFLLIIASEARRLALGSEHSRAILKALVWPRSRPPELGLSRVLLPR